MANQKLLSVLLIMCILKFGNGYYYYSDTAEKMKGKIIYLQRELVKDATRNYQRIEYMREYFKTTPVYDIGQMLYFIRSKLARMVRLFVLSVQNDSTFKTYHLHLPAMKEMHNINLEVYHLIEMLEEYEKRPKPKTENIERKIENMTDIQQQQQNSEKPPQGQGSLLRQRPINIPSFPKNGFYARKPNEAGRSGVMVDRKRTMEPFFDSDIE